MLKLYVYLINDRCWITTRRTRILQQWWTCLTGTYFRSLIQTGTLTRGKAQWLVRVAYTWYDFKGGCKKHRNKHYNVDIYHIAINASTYANTFQINDHVKKVKDIVQ